jgi:hypothetical protein
MLITGQISKMLDISYLGRLIFLIALFQLYSSNIVIYYKDLKIKLSNSLTKSATPKSFLYHVFQTSQWFHELLIALRVKYLHLKGRHRI